jgi:diketogulonate reductase-like aldo/keto reductase
MQVECHPYLTQESLRKYCKQRGIVVQAHGSLGMGSGKLWEDPEVAAIATESGMSKATVLLCWVMQQDIPVVVEASSEEHIAENMAAWALASAESSDGGGGSGGGTSAGPLSTEQIARLSALNKNEHFCWDPDTIKY